MDIYLIHGPDPVEIQTERMRVVDRLLPVDQRDENLTEFNPPGNRPLTLRTLLPDLLPELGTVSFFPGAKRVALVNDLSDFWSSKGEKTGEKPEKGKKKGAKKSDPFELLIRYLERDFESTGNALVFTVYEDPNKSRAVDKRRKFVQWLEENGHVTSFKGPQPVAFRLGDAILAKNLNLALALFREGYRKGRVDHVMAIFGAVTRQVRFLLQAKVAALAGNKLSKNFIENELLPQEKRFNLLKMHSFPQGKYIKAARHFSVRELSQALTDLYEINRHIIPSPDDPYVADVGYLMERLLIRLCSRTS